MMEEVEFLGSLVESDESFKTFVTELTDLVLDRKDAEVQRIIEAELSRKGVDFDLLTFHEGANHLEWAKDGDPFVVVERHFVGK